MNASSERNQTTPLPETSSDSKMTDQPRGRGGGRGNRGEHRGEHRGGRGGGRGNYEGRGGGGAGAGERPKKENILDLGKYMDKKITVKFTGGREGKFLFFFEWFGSANEEKG